MLLTIHGPNLFDQSKGDFHVHTAACSDNAKEVKRNGSVNPWTEEFLTAVEVAESVYADFLDDEGSTGADFLGEFYFAPCVKNLPTDGKVVAAA